MSSDRGPVVRRRRDARSDGAEEPESAPRSAETSPPAARPDERRAPAPRAGTASRSENTAPSAAPAPGRRSYEGNRAPRPIVGRRAYDPSQDRAPGPRPAPSGVLGPPGRKGIRRGAPRPNLTEEKQALRERAQALAKDKNIPLIHAYRILKGQTSLNLVL